jgi:hypothetical protein
VKLTIGVETTKNRVFVSALDGDRKIASGSGASVHEAATWLVKHVNRIARQTEALVLEAKLLTEEEIDEAVLHDDERGTAPSEG